MSFYKLFKIIYRRTDYYKLYDIVWKMIYPERYEQQQRELKKSISELISIRRVVNDLYKY